MRLTRRGLGGLGVAALAPSAVLAQAGVVRSLPMPCLSQQGDILGLVLEGRGAPAGRVVTFGQVFAQGDLPRGAGLAARLADGKAVPLQADVKVRHVDGSARFALLALAAPALAAGEQAGVVLHRGPAVAAAPFAPDLSRRSAILHLADQRLDLMAGLRQALREPAALWQAGPLAVQARIMQPMLVGRVTSLRVVADLTLTADGAIAIDLWLRNDGAMRPGGGALAYTARLLLEGREALVAELARHHHYTGWGRLLRSGPTPAFVRPDATYLAEAGATPRYDLSTGVEARLLESMGQRAREAAWASALGPRFVTQQMGRTGGRADIGPMTMPQAAWLQTGDPRAAAFAIGQAEAAGSIPWHFWDTEAGRWMDTRRWPELWTDGRGGAAPGGLAQPIAQDTGWSLASSHQPDLATLPWLLTGRRAFLDEVQAQACWCVLGQWPRARGTAGQPGLAEGVNVVRDNQVRGAAWSLRQLDNAAWASPEAEPNADWLREVAAANWGWIRQQLPRWTRAQGEAQGWIPGEYGSPGLLPPWQQDYFAAIAAAAARRGNADAQAVLDWMTNFLAGRFLMGPQGFPPHDGAAYLLAMQADADARNPLRSWRQIGAATRAASLSNGNGWSKTEGDYAQLALQSLAAVIDASGSGAARAAYDWLSQAGAPFTGVADYRRDPLLNIVPRGRPRVPNDMPRCR
ncbi:hypothetical protein [Falsiroseomonas sp.]|uniref:hypothetical protein n=1 Tax=Falsiroseomonas sp. TaxID=2870721 RepID=UPI003F720396